MTEHAGWLIAAAAWVGAHALALFFLGLLLLLLAAALAWRLLRRWLVPHQASTLTPPVFLLTRVVVGFGLLVGGAWAFAEIAEALGGGPALGQADQALADQIGRHVPPGAIQAFALLTHLGDAVTLITLCIAVAALLVWRGRRWLALGWVLALVGNGVLNPTLKQVFARARPVHDAIYSAPGYSFPSGHSSGAVVAYGMLAYVLLRFVPQRWHLAVVLCAVALAFTVACSRVFLRVHFASDVVAGLASGLAWLAVCVVSIELTRQYRQRASAGAAPIDQERP
ncbi:phosphatase PAP2 family protein [Ideonella sp. BN130291]|uniref:phosphatase PAP2 family protein n=1 Tax=Ideonella sp. BN130291 TaxID=3112940 RepID=UPI002E2543A5|nr:phosphatase PAP2 family protein [Ideonella sp. BN130291]